MSPLASTRNELIDGPERESLRTRVRSAGFDAVGFAAAGPAQTTERYRAWLERGHAGNMDYLAARIERRADPREIVEDARTVIVVSLEYHPGTDFSVAKARGDRAEIAAYARGTDYHRVMEKRLDRLCRKLREEYPGGHRYYVDTGPVLEREWAQTAGIGWSGKNTCTIDPETGSFFFLGVILSSLAIAPDAPSTDHCGTCRRCLDACPTDAFVAAGELDARRCIAYLNIEHRGEIDPQFEPAMANLVFGCDICQEVCPFNQRELPPPGPGLDPRIENEAPALAELAALDSEGFRERFPRSALRRAGFQGFLRNVIIALGNSHHSKCRAALDALGERDDVVGDDVLTATLARAVERSRER